MDLFANCDYIKENKPHKSDIVEKPNDNKVKVDVAEIQSRTLERQMNDWLKSKHGMNYERVTLKDNKTEVYDHDATNTFVDTEVKSYMKKKKWNSLPKSVQWNLIQEYCKENEQEDKLKEYKRYLETNKAMVVVYDNVTSKIISISM